MSHHPSRKVLAGMLTALGFSACTTEQPDLYGPMPVLYGPPLVDSTEVEEVRPNLFDLDLPEDDTTVPNEEADDE